MVSVWAVEVCAKHYEKSACPASAMERTQGVFQEERTQPQAAGLQWEATTVSSVYAARAGIIAAYVCGKKLTAEVMEGLHISRWALGPPLRVAVGPVSRSRWTRTRTSCCLSLCYTVSP